MSRRGSPKEFVYTDAESLRFRGLSGNGAGLCFGFLAAVDRRGRAGDGGMGMNVTRTLRWTILSISLCFAALMPMGA